MAILYPNPLNPIIINASARITIANDFFLRRVCFVSCGESEVGVGNYERVTSENFAAKAKTSTWLYNQLSTFFTFTSRNKECYILEAGLPQNASYAQPIAQTVQAINSGLNRCYIYAIPSAMLADTNVTQLLALTISTSAALYVASEVATFDASDAGVVNSRGNKGVLKVKNTSASTYETLGAVLGVFASSVFDITTSNPASPLNYKLLAGFHPTDITNTEASTATEQFITWAGTIGGQVAILGGRLSDGNPLDYWYQWDLVAYYVENAISSLLISGANNPRYVVKYNQDGIDMITSTIEATLFRMKSFGCISEFAAGYDAATGTLLQTDKIYSTGASAYIAANPDNYAAGIYAGQSAYLQIGRYLQQIVFNVTLG